MNPREELKAFADGELSEAQAAQVRAALEQSAELRSELAQLRSIAQSIKEVAPEVTAVGMHKTLAAIDKRSRRRDITYRLLVYGCSAGACLLVLAMIFPIFAQAKNAAKSSRAMYLARLSTSAPAAKAFVQQDSYRETAKAAAPSVRAKTMEAGNATGGTIRLRNLPGDSFSGHISGGASVQPRSFGRMGRAPQTLVKPSVLAGEAKNVVTLSFASADDGERRVLELVHDYLAPAPPTTTTAKAKVPSPSERTLTVLLPENTADQTIAQLKGLVQGVDKLKVGAGEDAKQRDFFSRRSSVPQSEVSVLRDSNSKVRTVTPKTPMAVRRITIIIKQSTKNKPVP